jgi:PAS domain S-box-containing protein
MHKQDHLIILDDGVVTWTSESLGQWLGSQWWRGHRLEDVLHVDQQQVVQGSSVDALVNDPTGRTHPVRLSALALTGDDKRDLVAVTVRPTEQLPTTDAEIAELATRFRLLVENTADVVVHTVEGVLEWVSPSIEDLTGWTPQELIGTTTAHLWHPEDADIAIRQREATYAGEPSRGTLRLLRKDGRYIWLDVALKPYRETDGRRGAVGSLRDVSDYVRVHQETEAQRARLQMLLDSMLEPHLLLQAVRDDRGAVCDFTVVMANPAAASRLRARVDDLLDLRVSNVFTHMDTDQIVDRLTQWLEAGEPVVLNDWQARAQGMDAYFDISISVLEDQLMVAWRDVTQRHEEASQLQESEEAYRLLTENAADLILRLDAAHRVVWVSPSSHRLLGYLPENLLGGFRWDTVYEDDRQPLREALDLLRHGDQSVTSLEVRLRHRHGPYAWWALNARRTRDDPTSSEIVIALSNIDAQKRQNLEVEREQAQRAAALQSMLDPHVLLQSVTDDSGAVVDFRYADANEAACSYMGMARDDLVGSTVLGLLPAHADTGLLDLYRRTLSTGEPLVLNGYAYPHEILGQTRRFDIRGVRIGDSLSFTWRDVTEQHEVARRLAESQEKYRLLAENATDVVFRTDARGNITFASEGVERLLGYTPQQVEGAAAIDYVHPDDRADMDALCTATGRTTAVMGPAAHP